MSWKKVYSIFRFELESTVKRPAYLISTFGMPIFLLLYGLLASLPAKLMLDKEREIKVFGVVDRSGILALDGAVEGGAFDLPPEARAALESSGLGMLETLGFAEQKVFLPFADETEARGALQDGSITAYYLIEDTYLETGRADLYLPESSSWDEDGARGSLGRLLRDHLMEDRLPADLAQRIQRPITASQNWVVTAAGEVRERTAESRVAGILVPIVFMMLLFVSVMMSAGFLIQGTAVEKENRVVEVLLASANPDEILLGKLLGLGLAGLFQIGVWLSMVLVAGLFATAMIAALGIEIPWLALAVAPPYFAAAYFFLGSLILGTGSIGQNLKEIQQYSMVWSLASAIPFFFIAVLMTDPNGTVGKVLTWIPFSAPMTVLLRLSLEPDGIAWWEVGGAFLVLLAATWLAIRFGARLFRVGLLLTGSRPKLREILRQARLSA